MERMVSFIHEGLGQVFVYSGIERMMSLHKGKNYFKSGVKPVNHAFPREKLPDSDIL